MSNINLLRLAEQNALAMSPQLALADGGGASSGSPSGFSYTGGGGKAKQKGKGLFANKKGLASLLVTLSLFVGGGFILGSSNTGLIGAIASNTNSAFNTLSAEDSRFPVLQAYMFKHADSSGTTNAILKPYRTMSNSFKKRLISNGFEVETSNGQYKLTMGNTVIDGDNLIETYRTNPEFRDKYNLARRSNVANFFDKMADRLFRSFGITRNRQRGFKQTGDADSDMKNYRKPIESNFDNNTSTLNGLEDRTVTVTDVDEEGNVIMVPDEDGNLVPSTHTETETVNETIANDRSNLSTTDARAKARATISDISSKAASVSDGVCAVMRIGTAISAMIAATNTMNALQYFAQTESISKAMVDGEGNQSGVNEFLNILTTPVTTKVNALEKVTAGGNEDTEVEVTGAPIEANGMQMALGNAPATPLTTKRYSLTNVIGPIAIALNMSMTQARVCAGLQATRALVSIATTVATFGVATIGQVVLNFGLSVTIASAASIALGFLVPTLASALSSNAFNDIIGIPAGEMYALGGALTYSKNGQTGSGQSFASQSVAQANLRAQQETIALEAEVNRLHHSPFDISSSDTFLGTVVNKLTTTALATSGNSVINLAGFSSLSRTAASSLASIVTKNASAAGENGSTYLSYFGDCPNLDEIGVVGDVYCVPRVATDTSTINLAPDDQKYLEVIGEALECSGDSCSIDTKSDLARYIAYCSNRQSIPGMIDQNILNAEEVGDGNVIINSLPIIGDIVDLINSERSPEALSWASGERCANNDKNSENWQTYKYYQRYISDQRMLEQLGAETTNPVASFIDEYEDSLPFSDTYTGRLARASGLTEDYTDRVLAYVDYQLYLQDYDPSSRLAMDGTASDPKTSAIALEEIKHDHTYFPARNDSHEEATTYIAYQPIVYADIRNRSYAV